MMYEGKNDYEFRGTHAQRVIELVSLGFFKRNIDVLEVAPVVGFEYNRFASENKQDDMSTKVFLKQLQDANERLELNYKTITLLDKSFEPDESERLKRAFQVAPEQRDPSHLERYESFVRGGVDYLYEKLVGTGNTPYERLMELDDLVDSFTSRYAFE